METQNDKKNGTRRLPPKQIDSETEVVTEPAQPRRVIPTHGDRIVAIAYVVPLIAMQFIGVGRVANVTHRIDPMSKEWAEWRIIVSGDSVLLIAPAGWKPTVQAATEDGTLTESFAPYAAAYGWEGADDVRQVFEIPRDQCQIRYYIDARAGELNDAELADAIRGRTIAAPDDRAREVWAQLEAEAEAEAEAMRAEAHAAAARRTVVTKPKPTPAATTPGRSRAKPPTPARGPEPLLPARSRKDDDDDAGMGDEGPTGPDEGEDF